MFNFFKKVQSKPCQHDWETVKYYTWDEVCAEVAKHERLPKEKVFVHKRFSMSYIKFTVGDAWVYLGEPWSSSDSVPEDEVCLRCGTCRSNFQDRVMSIRKGYAKACNTASIAIHRKNLAKKLWEENCIFKHGTKKEGLT